MVKVTGTGATSVNFLTVPFDGQYTVNVTKFAVTDSNGDVPRFRVVNTTDSIDYIQLSWNATPGLSPRLAGTNSIFLKAGVVLQYVVDQTSTSPTWEFNLQVQLVDDLV